LLRIISYFSARIYGHTELALEFLALEQCPQIGSLTCVLVCLC
jgi:hypothetical protein